jgi:hypothetical protein
VKDNPYGQKNDGGLCECSACGRTFGGLHGFDKHLIREGQGEDWWSRCPTDAELGEMDLHQDARGRWRGAWEGPVPPGVAQRRAS